MAAPILLPNLLQQQVEALAQRLLSPQGAPSVDFARPPGEPALVGPDSVSWRVFNNPVTLFVGGVAAVLLELAEPGVRHGVWDHSNFRVDPMLRLQRTGLAAMVSVYGPESAARAMIAGVNRMHARVSGVTASGEAYSATDPALLDWVEATAAFGFLEAYAAYARPLDRPERDLFYAEGLTVAALYGATGAPGSEAEWHALLAARLPRLESSSVLFDFLGMMRRVPALPRLGRPAQRMLVRAAVSILPPGLSERLRIGMQWHLRPWERPLVQAMARTANRLHIRAWPSVDALRRLGLPDDHLYR